MSVALIFPGQGSQQVGMHLDASGACWDPDTFAEADDALGYALSRVIAEGPEEALARTEVTQPALLATGVAMARRLLRREPDLRVVGAAGHSLGEYAALVLSGALDFGDAVRLVRVRGRAMQEAVPVGIGGMAAVLGLELAQVEAICADAAQGELVSIAADNCPGQVTVAGHVGAVDRVVAAAEEAGGVGKRLAVSAPFHCALLRPAADALAEALATVNVRAGTFPVLHNVDGRAAESPHDTRARLVAQVVAPVRWSDCFRGLRALGAEAAYECGPGRTLAGMARRIDKTLPVRSGA
jgi:[acyl-carrier-protein] S-malonyltransferase